MWPSQKGTCKRGIQETYLELITVPYFTPVLVSYSLLFSKITQFILFVNVKLIYLHIA